MLDLLALARLMEFCGGQDRERGRRDEDAFYQQFGAEPSALLMAITRALSFVARRRKTQHARKAATCKAETECCLAVPAEAAKRL
ncbi:hypothetical protein PYH37_000027 [Sinorhizobium numidicum]|uniref:Uncharacterized protein n=1 Tax=Sinorhizobium numidicum TaxID=680248 RepID=A0ABY8CQ21_9HYPH|nr:hypothetical protein [Sinorhizobium numidicum]WEX74756.1 hypothetical protein PYH37_000027 [Sinorhizobium numidicum]WEX80748.1 hypothetical protein PYH38_000029 [Sinorhizobium numidicum]